MKVTLKEPFTAEFGLYSRVQGTGMVGDKLQQDHSGNSVADGS